MKKIVYKAFGLLLTVSLVGCGDGETESTQENGSKKEENQASKTISISGTFTAVPGEKVYLYEVRSNKPTIVDSAVTNSDNGAFELNPQFNGPLDYYIISLNKSFPISLYVAEGENPVVNSDDLKLKSYSVEGSHHSALASEYLVELFEFQNNRSQWVKKSQELPYDAKEERQKYLDSVQVAKEKLNEKAIAFIEKNSDSPASILALGNLYPQGGIEQFDTTLLVYFDQIAEGMQENFPNTIYDQQISQDLKMIRSQIAQLNRPKGQMDDISLPDPNGNVRTLSDLQGKVVLVDFWASWCGPCRRENPNLVRMYQEYKDKGFDIYSVSLDGLPQQRNPKQEWITAIQQDGLVWENHVSDLQGWQSVVTSDFGVNSIPFTLLVDKDGSIIAKGLRGRALEEKLKEIL